MYNINTDIQTYAYRHMTRALRSRVMDGLSASATHAIYTRRYKRETPSLHVRIDSKHRSREIRSIVSATHRNDNTTKNLSKPAPARIVRIHPRLLHNRSIILKECRPRALWHRIVKMYYFFFWIYFLTTIYDGCDLNVYPNASQQSTFS